MATIALAVRFKWRCDATPAMDDSQPRADRGRDYSADAPASSFCVPRAVFDCLPAIAWRCWIPNVLAAE